MANIQVITNWGLRGVTACATALLAVGCVEVDGYRLRQDSTEFTDQLYATGGSTFGSPASGGTSSVATAARPLGGNTSGSGGLPSSGGLSATGGSPATTWHCATIATYGCSSMTTFTGCNRLPGCIYASTVLCSVARTYTCSDMSYSIAECALLPGCTSSGEGHCTDDLSAPRCEVDPISGGCITQPPECSRIASSDSCERTSNCRWAMPQGSCSGEPTACSTFTTSTSCASSYNCSWATIGTCSGEPTACESFATQDVCQASANCGWQVLPIGTGGAASTLTGGTTSLTSP